MQNCRLALSCGVVQLTHLIGKSTRSRSLSTSSRLVKGTHHRVPESSPVDWIYPPTSRQLRNFLFLTALQCLVSALRIF